MLIAFGYLNNGAFVRELAQLVLWPNLFSFAGEICVKINIIFVYIVLTWGTFLNQVASGTQDVVWCVQRSLTLFCFLTKSEMKKSMPMSGQLA